MLHHLHMRKRRTGRSVEPYPAKSLPLRLLDRLVLLAGIAGPFATLAQIHSIYSTHSAGNVSPVTFGTYAVFNVVWIVYGLVHREPPIVITYCLWFVVNCIVCVGAIVYA